MATIRDRYVLEVDTQGATRGVNNATGAIGGLAAGIGRLGPIAAAAGAALGAMAGIRGISNTISEMDDLAKAARNVGAASEESFDDFQVISNALGEMGLSSSETDRALRNLTTRLSDAAATGQGPAADAFALLGDRILDANGNLQSMPELFESVTGAIQDGTLSVNQAQDIFGEMVGPKILGGFEDLANRGVDVATALADVRENSNIIDLESATQAEAFGDTMGRLSEVAGRLGTEIVERLLPVLLNLAEGALAILPGLIDGVSAAFDALSPIFEAFQPVGQALFELLEALWPVFETLFSVIGPVAEIIGGALTLAIEGVVTVIETVIGVITRMIEGLQGIADKVREISGAVGQRWDAMTDGISEGAREAYENTTGWFSQMYDDIVGNSIIPDMADDIIEVFEQLNRGMSSEVAQGATDVARGFDDIAANISTGFNAYATSALNGVEQLVDQVTGGLYSKINNLTRQVSGSFGGIFDTVGSIFGGGSSGGGFLDSVIGGIGDLFGGFFANGGTLPAGKFGVVGERGPELITGPANITPFDQLGGQQQVIYNINAVDARSFRDLLARDPGYIHSLAQKGASRVPGRFA